MGPQLPLPLHVEMISQVPLAAADRPPGWQAWATSLALHSLLLALLAWTVRQAPVRGAADKTLRNAGIVLAAARAAESEQPEQEQAEHVANQAASEQVAAPSTAVDPAGRLQDDSPTTERADPVQAEPAASETLDDSPPLLGASTLFAKPASDGQAASGSGSRFFSGKTTVRVFGVEGEGTRFVYLFDRSDSMHGGPMAALKSELIASFESLEGVHQFHIIFFNHRVNVWDGGGGRVAFASDANKRAAANFVHGIAATGGTYRWDALRKALALRPDVIFFLTDTDNRMAERHVDEAIDRAQRAGVVIEAIEFGVGAASRQDNFLKRLAAHTRGNYVYVDASRLKP